MNKLYNDSIRFKQPTKQDIISKDCKLIEENMKGYQLVKDLKLQNYLLEHGLNIYQWKENIEQVVF